jgi:hypothetical protein
VNEGVYYNNGVKWFPVISDESVNAGTNDWRQYPETGENSAASPVNTWTWGNPVKGITNLDPCSELNSGVTIWRVPTQAEWAQIQSNNTWVWSDGNTRGYEIKPGLMRQPHFNKGRRIASLLSKYISIPDQPKAA